MKYNTGNVPYTDIYNTSFLQTDIKQGAICRRVYIVAHQENNLKICSIFYYFRTTCKRKNSEQLAQWKTYELKYKTSFKRIHFLD
mgnify:CR=1 FL=1